MGYVIRKQEKPVFVRLKNFSQIENKGEALDLLKRNEAQQRINAVIIIYSEIDFNDFYRKHCARIPNDENEFTILVREKENIPTRGEVRRLLEGALILKFQNEGDIILADIPENKYKVKKFYNTRLLSEPAMGCFRFRDINIDFPKTKLRELKEKGILTEEQYNKLEIEWKSSFTEFGTYFFEKILVIEHTDVIIKKKRLFF